jgi:hypothetical protein
MLLQASDANMGVFAPSLFALLRLQNKKLGVMWPRRPPLCRRCFAFLCRACIVHPQHTTPVHVYVKTYLRVLRNRCVSVVGACTSHPIPDRELHNDTCEDRQSVLVLSTQSFLMCCITADTIALSFSPLMLIYASLRP